MKKLASVIALSAGIGFAGGASAYAAGEYLHSGNTHIDQVEACARDLGAAETWENNFDDLCWPSSNRDVRITLPNGNWNNSTKSIYDALGQQAFMQVELSLARQEDEADHRTALILSVLGGAFASTVAFGCLNSFGNTQGKPPHSPARESAPEAPNVFVLPIPAHPAGDSGTSRAA